MFLEQMVDFLFWCILWLISDVHYPYQEVQAEDDFEHEQFLVRNEESLGEELNEPNDADTIENDISVDRRFTWFLPYKTNRGPLLPSIILSLQTVATIMLSAFFISSFAGIFAYLDMETTDKCIGIEHYSNTSIPSQVMKWKLIGESFPVMLLNFWFPATISLLYGGMVFLERHKPLLYIGLIMGLLVVIYKAYLFIFSAGPNFIDSYRRYPSNLIFLLGLVLSCFQIARATNQSKKSIFLRIGLVFVFSLVMSISYRYIFVPWFNKQSSEVNKALIAAIIPLFSLIPVAVSKYVVLCHFYGIASPRFSYILVYFNYLAPVAIYRMMQAELTELKYFIAFSLLHGIFYILVQVSITLCNICSILVAF